MRGLTKEGVSTYGKSIFRFSGYDNVLYSNKNYTCVKYMRQNNVMAYCNGQVQGLIYYDNSGKCVMVSPLLGHKR